MTDRRVRRTRNLLGSALVELILEKGYDRVTVQDVLDRADVGRSTFYAHFRDKDALLMAGFDDMATQLRADIDALAPGVSPPTGAPAAALFTHAWRHRDVYAALFGRRGSETFRRNLHVLIADTIRGHLAPHLAAARSDLPLGAVVEFAASSAIGLLVSWVDEGFPTPPDRMAAIYQRLVAPGVTAALAAPHL